MKVILVPTDFTYSARNAISYAASLAGAINAKLILFHSFQIQLPSPDFPVLSMTGEELEHKAERILQKTAADLRKQYGIKVEAHVHSGFHPPEEIVRLTKRLKPELIVMGIKDRGRVTEFFIGSTPISVMRNIDVPVMIIPENAVFIKPEKILLAVDYSFPVESSVLSPLLKISKVFQSEVYVVNILESGDAASEKKSGSLAKLDKALQGTKHVYYFPTSKNLMDGIDDFLAKHKAVMIAMIPHKHVLIERLFGKSNTASLATHFHIPLLALPDSNKHHPAFLI